MPVSVDWSSKHCKKLSVVGNVGFAVVDYFDQLPDSILLLIFNKISDVKALGRCCAVSKRFQCLAPTVDNVVVKVDCVISGEESTSSSKGKGFFGSLMRLVNGSIFKPLHSILGSKRTVVSSSSSSSAAAAEVSHHSPGEVLKNFKDVQHLRIELPGGELEIEDGFFLKWRAEFGSTLESCVILGASSLIKRDPHNNNKGKKMYCRSWLHRRCSSSSSEFVDGAESSGENDDNLSNNNNNNNDNSSSSIAESLYIDGGLKLRVVWTISSLIAASGRHYLLQQIIADHPSLETLILTDADGQGMLCMNKMQLEKFRDKPIETSPSSNRTQVPALNIKLWYAPHIQVASAGIGIGFKGATLVVIKPSHDSSLLSKDSQTVEFCGFEEPFQTAALELLKHRTYWLEMNSF